MWIGSEWVERSSGKEPVRRISEESAAMYDQMVNQVVELAEMAEEAALAELEAFGVIEFEPQFDWGRKSTPEERGWSRAVLDIIAFEGAANAESLFELF